MKNGIATMSIDKNGVPNIGVWGRDIVATSALDSARQNLDPIVDNGVANPDLLTDPNRKWGFTGPKNKTAVWRSGVGITADHHLIWVGGPGLTIDALAHTLIRAGAIRGMELWLNPLQTFPECKDSHVTAHTQPSRAPQASGILCGLSK